MRVNDEDGSLGERQLNIDKELEEVDKELESIVDSSISPSSRAAVEGSQNDRSSPSS